MSTKQILKKLKSDQRFIPFNDKFNYLTLLDYTKDSLTEADGIEVLEKVICTEVFNHYYQGLRAHFNELLNSGVSRKVLMETVIALANRDFYLLSTRTKASIIDKPEINLDAIMNSSFQSEIDEAGFVDVRAALEAGFDGLNTVLNLFRTSSDKDNGSIFNFSVLNQCSKLMTFANIHTVVKSGYDLLIWEDYRVRPDLEKKMLTIKLPTHHLPHIHRIGDFRLNRNVLSFKLVLNSNAKMKDPLYQMMESDSALVRTKKRLKKVEFHNGELRPKLASGVDTVSITQELQDMASLAAYYGYLTNERLPKLPNMAIRDILVIFSEIQVLFQKAFDYQKVETDNHLTSFKQFGVYMLRIELINYVLSKTTYSRPQVASMIDLLSSDSNHYNVWERPFIKQERKLLPVFLPLLSANLLRLTDYWLEKGGIDLDTRGPLFEKYLKNILTQGIQAKGYEVKVNPKTVFTNKKGESEEIDLIVELKNVTLIAEVKCVRYPFGPRDYHNMKKRLFEGVAQIKRKNAFILKHRDEFEEQICFSKKIINAVITNYPSFSGHVENGVPITDASMLDNYILGGKMRRVQITSGGKTIQNRLKSEVEQSYYTNEDEMSNNLFQFLCAPAPVMEKLSELKVTETQISFPSAEPKIMMEYLDFPENNII